MQENTFSLTPLSISFQKSRKVGRQEGRDGDWGRCSCNYPPDPGFCPSGNPFLFVLFVNGLLDINCF